jgi:hypothetical protein
MRLHIYFIKKKMAERMAYTTQLWRSHNAGYKTTEKVVVNLNLERKAVRGGPPPQT